MVRAKRSLSQNFLTDPNLRRKLVAELGAGPQDSVLEVGPGHGELSDVLAGSVSRLVLVEKDDRLAEILSMKFAGRPDVAVVHGDALDEDLSALAGVTRAARVISNLPYSITSPLIFRFLDMRPVPARIVVLVQREVADRIVAAPGSRTYGALSVGVQTVATAHLAFPVGRNAFRPVPRVDSAAVVIEPADRVPVEVGDGSLRTLTRVTFSRRRKQLQKILRTAPEYGLDSAAVARVLDAVGLDGSARPETLAPEQFTVLARVLKTELSSN